ncbi:hypothetical protein ACFVTF_07700 [Kitasatospora sp. NPDC057940]|uniref:hypothetical protein n=1 Tax=Kitasatospora sp. NPDC057940 TaxID=3346285 RepID=UPI0036DE092A
MATYTSAIQRKQIWPDRVVWATPVGNGVVGFHEWEGTPNELAQTVLRTFLEKSQTGVAPDGYRAVVWAGDRREEIPEPREALAIAPNS